MILSPSLHCICQCASFAGRSSRQARLAALRPFHGGRTEKLTLALRPPVSGGIYRSDTISGAKCRRWASYPAEPAPTCPGCQTPDGGNGPQANSLHRLPGRCDLHVRVVRYRGKTCREGTVKAHPSWPRSRVPTAAVLSPSARELVPALGACRAPAGHCQTRYIRSLPSCDATARDRRFSRRANPPNCDGGHRTAYWRVRPIAAPPN